MLSALAAIALAAAGPRLEASLLAGGGYDSNLNHAERDRDAVGAGFVAARGSLGSALDVGDSTGLYLGLRLDAEQYPDLSDLTTGAAGVEASLVRELGSAFAIAVVPSASRSWSGDEARDVTALAAQVTLRAKPVRDLALRLFYGHASRSAEDPAFSSERDRLGGSVEWRARRRTWLSVAYAAELGDEVFYAPVATSETRMGRHPVTTFGVLEEAYAAYATSHAVTPSIEIGLGPLHLQASYQVRWVRSDAGDFRTSSVFGGVGVRR